MSPIGSIAPLGVAQLTRIDAPGAAPFIGTGESRAASPTESFGQILDTLATTVESKAKSAEDVTRQVLLGKNDQLHQSVIAMQEATVAFSLMIEMRNKLVESYQELMRMQV